MFVARLGRASSTEGRATVFIGYMDIYRLMVYVQQVEEDKMSIEKSTEIRRKRLGMSLANRMVVRADHNSINQRGVHHHLIVHLRQETKVSIVS